MANGRPERSVASATLASVPSLPRAAMSGHVMPSFPHTLIGLGPFADLGCKIVFTKTAVTVYHPDGHPILAGWRDETGPRLWHFPLTADAAQVVLENGSPQVPIPLTAEAAYVAVDTALHPTQLAIPPRNPRKRQWRRRRTRARPAAGTQRRHAAPRQRVTFTLLPHHVDKDSTFWRRIQPEEPTCNLQHSLRSSRIPAKVSLPPARPGPPTRYTTSTGPPRLLLWLPGLLVLPSIRAALICPALVPWLVFIMPVLVFQSNKPGSMPSRPATVTPLKASPTPMQPSIVRTLTKPSWVISPSNAKTSGRQKPSSLRRFRWWFSLFQVLQLRTRSSS